MCPTEIPTKNSGFASAFSHWMKFLSLPFSGGFECVAQRRPQSKSTPTETHLPSTKSSVKRRSSMVRSFSSGGITRQRAQQPPAKTSVAQDQSLQDWAACFKAAMSTFVVSEKTSPPKLSLKCERMSPISEDEELYTTYQRPLSVLVCDLVTIGEEDEDVSDEDDSVLGSTSSEEGHFGWEGDSFRHQITDTTGVDFSSTVTVHDRQKDLCFSKRCQAQDIFDNVREHNDQPSHASQPLLGQGERRIRRITRRSLVTTKEKAMRQSMRIQSVLRQRSERIVLDTNLDDAAADSEDSLESVRARYA